MFILFAGYDYDAPKGGAYDIVRTSDTGADLELYIAHLPLNEQYEWAHIYDTQTGEITKVL